MPTLDDAPIIAPMTGAAVESGDLIQIYDVSTQKPKTITVAQLVAAMIALELVDAPA